MAGSDAASMRVRPTDGPVILFDGVCALCDGLVRFVVRRDPVGRFRFAPLQSRAARDLLEALGHRAPADPPASVMLVENGRVYEASDAALRIARSLRGPWRALWILALVPRPLRDAVYRFVAARRYRWFGRHDTCTVPSPELRSRMLE
ncbi:MAG: thiol-disulfide oxidoreductase DCC family protein [Myxococcota bacterium]|nr:thiol-disulfide oxidoreductase DCC family protein [Myxococcota bacterium]MDW8363103.1 thiol-disulfide oxidoreductase DCC family protein [Myxococcales bacterium]